MADDKRLQATLDIKVSDEAHRSLDAFLAKCERAEKLAAKTREHLNAAAGGGTSPAGFASPSVGPSVPYPSGGTSSYSAATGFVRPGDPLGGAAAVGEMATRLREVEQTTRRVKENLQGAAQAARSAASDLRHNPDLDAAFGFGPAVPPSASAAGAVYALQRAYGGGRGGIGGGGGGGVAGGAGFGDGGLVPYRGIVPYRGQANRGRAAGDVIDAEILGVRSVPLLGAGPGGGGEDQYQQQRAGAGAGFDFLDTMNRYGGGRRGFGQRIGSAAGAFGRGIDAFNAGATKLAGRVAAPLAALEFFSAAAGAGRQADFIEATGGSLGEQARGAANGTLLTREALGIVDAFRGRPQDIALAEYKARLAMTGAVGEEGIRRLRGSFETERFAYDREASVRAADARFATVGEFDRRSVAGNRAYEESLVMLPVERERIERERRLKIEQGTLSDLEGQRGRLQQELAATQVRMGPLDPRNENRPGGAATVAQIREWERLNVKQEGILRQLDDLQGKIESKKRDVAQATVDINKLSAEELQGRLQIAGGRENTARGQARRAGAVTDYEFQRGVSALKMIQQAGTTAGIPQAFVGFASQIDPEFVSQIQENTGIKRIDQAGLIRDKVGSFRDRLPDAEAEVRRLTNQLEETNQKNAAAMAAIMAKAVFSPEALKMFEQIAKQQIAIEAAKVRGGQAIKNVQGK